MGWTHNPPLSGDYVEMNAYNLFPGAAFLELGRVHVVMEVRNYHMTEQVAVKARIADDDGTTMVNEDLERPFIFHYMRKIALLGAVQRPTDYDDNDWGNS